MSAKKIIDKLFSTSAAGLYIILFAAAIGTATFIENDFGTTSAQKIIFQSRLFELLLILFGITIIVNIFRFRMIQQRKWSILTFHAATIVILVGAAATRYFGSEGIMHIREGESTNLILSNETFLQFEIRKDGDIYKFDEEVFFASLGRNKFKEQYQIGNEIIDIELTDFVPNPVEILKSDQSGESILKVVMGGGGGREEYLVRKGDKININGILFNFAAGENSGAINIRYHNDSLQFKTDQVVTQMVMATQRRDTLYPGPYRPLLLRSLYTCEGGNFVISEFNPYAGTIVTSSSPKMNNNSVGMARINITAGGKSAKLDLKGNKGMIGKPEIVALGSTGIKASYGAKYIGLPFSLKLRDFIMERYPGTSSASSYASEVTLIDESNNIEREQRIFMNNILNYGGYRFFQSSFDKDELGTVLSVNHDALGTWISYFGYFLLTLGMVVTLFSKKSRFFNLSRKLKDMRLSRKLATIFFPALFLVGSFSSSHARDDVIIDPSITINAAHAASFGELVVQDHNGRMKPMNTLSSEILRK
ncbi:MAG: cytochrome c biogenesis protein ResB, partial [Saprospiraceae bacterium]|nr:cytochrome c biogenesis protein ResB [Saprospiraceae bacterium]